MRVADFQAFRLIAFMLLTVAAVVTFSAVSEASSGKIGSHGNWDVFFVSDRGGLHDDGAFAFAHGDA